MMGSQNPDRAQIRTSFAILKPYVPVPCVHQTVMVDLLLIRTFTAPDLGVTDLRSTVIILLHHHLLVVHVESQVVDSIHLVGLLLLRWAQGNKGHKIPHQIESNRSLLDYHHPNVQVELYRVVKQMVMRGVRCLMVAVVLNSRGHLAVVAHQMVMWVFQMQEHFQCLPQGMIQ